MKYGFALIELIVATLIASMVAGILLAALSQGNRFQLIIDNTIDFSSRISIVTHQLEKDLSGAFIPTQAESQKDQKKEESPAEETEGQQQEKKPAGKKEEVEQKGAEKKEQKPIEKIFYSINKSGKFDRLTFITNNPLEVYVSKDIGVVKPKVVRVQYSLKPEVGKKDSYALFRQESMELDLEKYKDVRAYEVIGGIKECTVKFIARIEKKKETESQKASEKPKIEYEYKTLNEWVSERKKDTEQKEKEEFPRIPYNVEITLVLWNMQDTREETYTIICQIPIDFSEPKKEEKKQPEQPARTDKQPEAAGTTDKTGKAGKTDKSGQPQTSV